jgi:hypothetical protein
MSAVRSLTGGKRTCRGKPISVAIDPKATSSETIAKHWSCQSLAFMIACFTPPWSPQRSLMMGLFMSGRVDLSATKLGSVPSTGRKRQGLRRLSPDLISKAIDETSAQVTRIGLTFLGTAPFCLLSLLSPDSALLGGSEKINVPLAGPVSFFGFILLGPAVLIMLRVYLQIYVEHSNRLERLGRSMLAVRAPTLAPLKNPLIRVFSGLTFYLVLPVAMILFALKAAVFPPWGSALLCAAVGIIASHAVLPLGKLSWRSKALLSISASIIAGGVVLGFGPLHRPFYLERANLSNQSLVKDNLSRAILIDANLSHAILIGANLNRANLFGANLSDANLGHANLTDAYLTGANLTGAFLAHANLTGAHLTNLSGAILSDANLSGADRNYANLSHAILNRAILVGANLSDADLSGADLRGADLRGSKNLSQTQLDKGCGNEETKLPEGLTLKPCD